jgi:regulator of sigma E protease
MYNIIGAIIALGVLVTVHEFGHFVAARIFGVEVEKFSIGFGPKIFGFTKGKTKFLISAIPMGGYLKMKGENPDEEVENTEGSFQSKTWWQRSVIAFAGPFFNLIFALLIFILSFSIGRSFEDNMPVIGKINSESVQLLEVDDTILQVNGNEITGWNSIVEFVKEENSNTLNVLRNGEEVIIEDFQSDKASWYSDILPKAEAIIGEVAPGLPAYRAGLKKNDMITAINGKEVIDWYEMRKVIQSVESNTVIVTIQREDAIFKKEIELEENLLEGNRVIGITQYLPIKVHETYSISESVKYGTFTTVNFVYMYYQGLYKLLLKPSSLKSSLGGPVMIYTMSKQSASHGWDSILSFIAGISIILMVMNLLPIPVLDGGHIFFNFIEGIFRKPLPIKVQMIFQRAGFAVLLMLMFFAFFNDFSRIFKRSVSLKQIENTENVGG